MIFNLGHSAKLVADIRSLLEEKALDYELLSYDRSVLHLHAYPDNGLLEEIDSLITGTAVSTASDPLFGEVLSSKEPLIIAGPCSVESEEQLKSIVKFLRDEGIEFIRGGAFKPRTSPDSFQGLGKTGIKLLSEIAGTSGLKIVTEVMDRSQIDLTLQHAHILQVGSRNMFNYTLLTALGAVDKPILLKRGMSATIDEWIQSSAYITRGGNQQILMCERGIRTFEHSSRYTLDIVAVPEIKRRTTFPIIIDPSHAAGEAGLVPQLAIAGLAAGADGVIFEIHPNPPAALSDGRQALSFSEAAKLIRKIRKLAMTGVL